MITITVDHSEILTINTVKSMDELQSLNTKLIHDIRILKETNTELEESLHVSKQLLQFERRNCYDLARQVYNLTKEGRQMADELQQNGILLLHYKNQNANIIQMYNELHDYSLQSMHNKK